MLNQRAIARPERNNAAAAAHVLRNRDTEPLAMVLWAETCQRRQRAERANTVTLEQLPLPLQGVARS